MAYNNNENKTVGARKPRKRRAMGLVVATAVAAGPAIGCEDRGPAGFGNVDASQMEAASTDTGSNADATLAMDTGSSTDATPETDAGGMDAIVDAGHDAYADGVRG